MTTVRQIRDRMNSHAIKRRIRSWLDKNDLFLQVAYWDESCRGVKLSELVAIWYPIVMEEGELLEDCRPYLANHLEIRVVGKGHQKYERDMVNAPHYMEI